MARPHHPRVPRRIAFSLVIVCVSATEARADVASWLFVGGGASKIEQGKRVDDLRSAMQIESGFGTTPAANWVFGGILRTHTHFDSGTDLALLTRMTTGGYSRGDFGLALDLGGYKRYWEQHSAGFAGSLVLGAPWGIALSGGAYLGTHEHRTYTAVLGIDLARLTVHRTTGHNWWSNPFPSPR